MKLRAPRTMGLRTTMKTIIEPMRAMRAAMNTLGEIGELASLSKAASSLRITLDSYFLA